MTQRKFYPVPALPEYKIIITDNKLNAFCYLFICY